MHLVSFGIVLSELIEYLENYEKSQKTQEEKYENDEQLEVKIWVWLLLGY